MIAAIAIWVGAVVVFTLIVDRAEKHRFEDHVQDALALFAGDNR